MQITDLLNCDQEPIHILGKIQSHGFLIAANQKHIITFCSENISSFLPVSALGILNQQLVFLEYCMENAGSEGFLSRLIDYGTGADTFESFNPYPITIKNQVFNLIISTSGDQYLLEFEPEYSDLKSNLHRIISRSLSEMLAVSTLAPLLEHAGEQIKSLIGYDRVMIYKFHKDGHGEVVAEAKNEELEPLLGFHYPASDIPKQARDLYKVNLIRLIADVQSTPSAIATLEGIEATVLDLSPSVLRAVSPIHIQYLKNMGVASSFSISLLCEGELWGLIACHNYTQRFINYNERESSKLIGQVLSTALSFREQEEDRVKSNRLQEAIVILSKGLMRNEDIAKTLFDNKITLLDAVDATGVVLTYGETFYTKGLVPHQTFLSQLLVWLGQNMDYHFYESTNFSSIYPDALPYAQIASGILACRLSKELNEYMIWFKPEIINTIKWAGNPEKPVEVNEENGLKTILPRKSFETWTQQVRAISTPWTSEDVKSALLIREEITFALNKKAVEVRMLNEKLQVAYEELNAFSYTISHDLKNPLSSIKGFGQLLVRNPSLNKQAQLMAERILRSADKMQIMISEVLRYSQIDQNKIKPTLVNMNALLQELSAELLAGENHQNLSINVNGSLDVYGDYTMVMQVFSNLLSNAVKYSKNSPSPVVNVSCQNHPDVIQYSVSDNGIGIHPADLGNVFELFARAEEVKDYEGTGVGLSIVKKIIEKHDGKIWIESTVGSGSTFHVVFNKPLIV